MKLYCRFAAALAVSWALVFQGVSLAQTTAGADDAKAYDPAQTVLCLNYATESLCKIITYNDVVVLEQEYENIINNINQSKIKDTEIVDLIKGLMDALTAGRINDQQKKRIAGQYEQQVANALYTAFGDARGGSMNVIGAVNPLGLAMAAVSSVGSSYFNYRRNLEAYRQQRESAEWEINKQILADLNNLRKSFFENSVRLTQKYNFPDEWRLSEKQLQDYIDAEKDTDPEKRVMVFQSLTD